MRAFTFKRTVLIALGGTFLLALAILWSIFQSDVKSQEEYAALVGEANPGKTAKAAPYTAQQHRKGVQKDLLFSRNGERLHLRLVSKDATMVLEHKPEGTFLLEQMQDVKCWMQEELLQVEGKPTQLVRYLEADSATYSYKNDEVIATDVKVFRYTLPGHLLPISMANFKPSMKGHAEMVQFSMGGQDVQFKAQKLKASMEGGAL